MADVIVDNFPGSLEEQIIMPAWKFMSKGRTRIRECSPKNGWLIASSPIMTNVTKAVKRYTDGTLRLPGESVVSSYQWVRPELFVTFAFAIDVLAFNSKNTLSEGAQILYSTLLYIPAFGPYEVTDALWRISKRTRERARPINFVRALEACAFHRNIWELIPEEVTQTLKVIPRTRKFPL